MDVGRPAVAVIIPNYNGWRDSERCLISLESALAPRDHVIFVDNGSSDRSVEAAARWFRGRGTIWTEDHTTDALRYTILALPANIGFGAACNKGLAAADGYGLYWILNNDTEVDRLALTELVEAANMHPDAGFVGSYIYVWPDEQTTWFNGASIDLWTGEVTHYLDAPVGRVNEVDYVSACSMLARGAALKAAGAFHPAFFMYYEETDLQLRARRHGYRSYVAERSRVGHKVGMRRGVSPFCSYHTMRSQVLLLRMHGISKTSAIPSAIVRRIGGHLWRRRFHAILPAVRGVVEAFSTPIGNLQPRITA